MAQTSDELNELLSGYIDGELGAEERARVEARLASDEAFRREYESMRRLAAAASSLNVRQPPEEVWDTFLDNVYNRTERWTGWTLFILGAVALGAFGIYHFVVDPWASPLEKTLIATPLIGLGIVFVSVLRQRLFVRKTDRYSREVKR